MQATQNVRTPTMHPPQSLMRVFRPITGLSNLTYDTTTLYKQEIEALIEIIVMVLNCFPQVPTKGTLILDGQKHNQAAQCILRASLIDGASYLGTGCAEQAIDQVLGSSDPNYAKNGVFGVSTRGIISQTLVLNTTNGRFLATIVCENILNVIAKNGSEENVLLALAVALGRMGLEDTVLQEHLQEIKTRYQHTYSHKQFNLMREIERLFDDCQSPALQQWQEWHEPANQNGELKLFFD